MNPSAPTSLLLCLLATPLAAQSLTLAEGAAQGQLKLLVHDETRSGLPSKVFLDKVGFLPLEITQRTAMQDLRTDRPRRKSSQGLWRIELPSGGRIFRYQRSGGTRFGYLLIRSNGAPLVLLELAGAGLGGTSDPFADRFGVSADGKHAAISTAAGALYLVRLDGGAYASSKTPARLVPVTGVVEAKSLAVGKRVLFFQTGKTRLWRLALIDKSKPVEIGPPIAPGGRLEEEMALSGDGSRLAFLAGPKKLQHIYIAGEAGRAARVTSKAAKYEDAGYLPETTLGPSLLLDEKGLQLFYVDSTIRDEIYVRDLLRPLGLLHITSNTHFKPYIGTGVLPAFVAGKLMVGIGNPKAFDWYLADSGKGTVLNLSLSKGNTKPPYGAGSLNFNAGSSLAGGKKGVVVEALAAGGYRLHLYSTIASQKPWIIDGLKSLPGVGSATMGSGDLLISRSQGDLLLDEGSASLLLAAPPGFSLAHPIKTASFRFFQVQVAGFSLPLFYQPKQFLLALPPMKGKALPILTATGALVLHGSQLLYFGPQWASMLPKAKGLRFVLSGQGA